MAGILNNKQRIMDAIFTVDGRRQMAAGTIKLSFVSFTDEGMFYDSDDGETARDLFNPGMITLEAVSLPKDVIIPEAGDDGMFSLSLIDNSKIVNGRQIVSGSNIFQSGSQNSYSGSLSAMSTAVQHFDWNQIIATIDSAPEDKKQFSLQKTVAELTTEFRSYRSATINQLRPMIFDNSLNHMANLKYMPPEYEENGQTLPLGNYSKLTGEEHKTFDTFQINELFSSISGAQIKFSSTSEANNLLGQCFEIRDDGITKLVAIDYGEFREGPGFTARVFYLGKIIRDAAGTPKFVRLFTLVFR